MNSEARLHLDTARAKVADAQLFAGKLQSAVSLGGVIDRPRLNLAAYHLGEVAKLLAGPAPTSNAPSIGEVIQTAKAIAQKEGRLP